MGSITPYSHVDVLIIGAGPAGLMAAQWFSRLGINTRIVDKRPEKVSTGQADGIQARTLEIWDSFGIADRFLKDSYPLLEINSWARDESGNLIRTGSRPENTPGESRFGTEGFHQGNIERVLLESIQERSDIRVERATLPESIELDETQTGDDDYPITVTLRRLSKDDQKAAEGLGESDGMHRSNLTEDDSEKLIRNADNDAEVVKAKYVIGCDGAHSWTRHQLGFEMEGDATDHIWGVLDIVPITDFPDIRAVCSIRGEAGNILLIPREDKLVRIYIQLQDIVAATGARDFDKSQITPEVILRAAQKIFHPYKMEYVHRSWWTCYRVGQRVSNSYGKGNRIFLAGDAVHTHSPKEGQGMNISSQDTYNLCWKIGLILQKKLKRSILDTYEPERRPYAKKLIDIDYEVSRAYSKKARQHGSDSESSDEDSISDEDFSKALKKALHFKAEAGGIYEFSDLVIGPSSKPKPLASKPELAREITLGKRLPNFQVLRHCDSKPVQFQAELRSDGRFRVLVFGGDITQKALLNRVNKLGSFLGRHLLPKYTDRVSSSGLWHDCTIEVLLLHCAPRYDVDQIRDLDEVYRPFEGEYGYDLERVFTDQKPWDGVHGQAYTGYGVEKNEGCVVIVRPDQHVSWIGGLEDEEQIQTFFDRVLIAQDR